MMYMGRVRPVESIYSLNPKLDSVKPLDSSRLRMYPVRRIQNCGRLIRPHRWGKKARSPTKSIYSVDCYQSVTKKIEEGTDIPCRSLICTGFPFPPHIGGRLMVAERVSRIMTPLPYYCYVTPVAASTRRSCAASMPSARRTRATDRHVHCL